MSIELIDVSGFEQSKIVLAHLNKFYADKDGNFCLCVDKRLALKLEKNIRRNAVRGIHMRLKIQDKESLVQVALVKYIWTRNGMCIKFKKVHSPKSRVSWWRKLLQSNKNI